MSGLPGSLTGGSRKPSKSAPQHLGDCVVCKHGVYDNQTYGRAPKPLLGKAHTWCGGESE